MFKFVVLCAFLAAATADPSGAFYAQPLTYSSTVISPAVTTISKSASSVVHPSPAYYPYYSTPSVYSHFIKKRGAPFYFPTTYAAGSPLLATAYSTPLVHSAPLLTSTPYLSAPIAAAPLGYATAAHLIKKRSAPLLPYSAYTPLTYSSPLISHTPLISAAPYYSTPYISHAPLAIPHLIKKRSAPILASAYIAPTSTSYSHQSRIDYNTPYVSHYSAPLAYTSPYAYTHVY